MNVEKIYDNKELTIKVYTQIDTVEAKDFQNEINSEMGKFDSLIMDFEKLEFISSAGLRVLMFTQNELSAREIPFTIVNISDEIEDIIVISGLDNFLNIEGF